jgi:Sulfotransferase family
MAILCREVGLLLIQAPHTGSTSLGTLLRERLGGEMLVRERVRDRRGRVVLRQKHQTLAQLLEAGLITPGKRNELFVIVGVRDPYDLVFTEYARNREAGAIPAPERLLRRSGLLRSDHTPADFERFVRRRYRPGPLLRLIGRRAFVPVDWTAGVDHVIRFERMQADLDEALRRVGVTEPLPLPHRNPTSSRADRHYSALYTPAARAIVEAAYRRELDRFGYVFAEP